MAVGLDVRARGTQPLTAGSTAGLVPGRAFGLDQGPIEAGGIKAQGDESLLPAAGKPAQVQFDVSPATQAGPVAPNPELAPGTNDARKTGIETLLQGIVGMLEKLVGMLGALIEKLGGKPPAAGNAAGAPAAPGTANAAPIAGVPGNLDPAAAAPAPAAANPALAAAAPAPAAANPAPAAAAPAPAAANPAPTAAAPAPATANPAPAAAVPAPAPAPLAGGPTLAGPGGPQLQKLFALLQELERRVYGDAAPVAPGADAARTIGPQAPTVQQTPAVPQAPTQAPVQTQAPQAAPFLPALQMPAPRPAPVPGRPAPLGPILGNLLGARPNPGVASRMPIAPLLGPKRAPAPVDIPGLPNAGPAPVAAPLFKAPGPRLEPAPAPQLPSPIPAPKMEAPAPAPQMEAPVFQDQGSRRGGMGVLAQNVTPAGDFGGGGDMAIA